MEERLSTNRNEIKAKIRAALAGQTTGLLAGEIRERGGLQLHGGFMAALLSMKARGEVLKHEGETPRTSRYSLNPEQIADAPPQRRKATKAAKKPGRKPGKKRQARSAAVVKEIAPATARAFTPALTADSELVLVSAGQPALFFTPEQTVAIATLLAANFG